MGKADIDLPDPYNKPSLGNAPSADDLLSQMAGDEIDRLLNEAEAQPVAAKDAGAPPEHAEAVTEEQLDALLAGEEVEEPKHKWAAKAKAPEKAPDPQLNNQLDALFAELNNPQAEKGAPAAAAKPVAKSEAAPVAAKTAAVDPAEQTGSLEREVLAAEILDEPEPAETVVVEEAEAVERVPLVVRLLEVINLPVAGLSQKAIGFMGAVAIVTLLNALGILGYVLMFRK